MRIVSFERQGQASFGIVVGEGVIDAGQRLGGRYRSLRELLLAGALDQLKKLPHESADLALADLRQLPVIPDLGSKILCIGSNYTPHIKEMGREPPKYPVVFIRFADSQVGHLQPLMRPRLSESFDYEGELAIIIGKTARYVSKADTFEYIAGYSCFNDGSIRDWQRHTHQFAPGKNFPGSGSFGPWMVTSDELPDPTRCHLTTRLNGQIMQEADVAELFFDIPTLMEYCSSWTTLNPGDVIVTGTPGGVGAARKPPVWMRPGDTVEVEISGVGLLRNSIVDEPAGV
jgi:2-keto-4-pentenoate hydratase/2-oxohepta-3-ene-1,7-dioic acid hydratase in catechol pathway